VKGVMLHKRTAQVLACVLLYVLFLDFANNQIAILQPRQILAGPPQKKPHASMYLGVFSAQ